MHHVMSAHLDEPREPGADTTPAPDAPPDPEMVVAQRSRPTTGPRGPT